MELTKTERRKTLFLGLSLIGLVLGLALHLADLPDLATGVWLIGVLPVLAALVVEIVRSLLRGDVGLDIVAALSMSAALIFGEQQELTPRFYLGVAIILGVVFAQGLLAGRRGGEPAEHAERLGVSESRQVAE